MKRILSVLVVLLYAVALLAKPYTQQGIAYLYDYKTKTKKPVANVDNTYDNPFPREGLWQTVGTLKHIVDPCHLTSFYRLQTDIGPLLI